MKIMATHLCPFTLYSVTLISCLKQNYTQITPQPTQSPRPNLANLTKQKLIALYFPVIAVFRFNMPIPSSIKNTSSSYYSIDKTAMCLCGPCQFQCWQVTCFRVRASTGHVLYRKTSLGEADSKHLFQFLSALLDL